MTDETQYNIFSNYWCSNQKKTKIILIDKCTKITESNNNKTNSSYNIKGDCFCYKRLAISNSLTLTGLFSTINAFSISKPNFNE